MSEKIETKPPSVRATWRREWSTEHFHFVAEFEGVGHGAGNLQWSQPKLTLYARTAVGAGAHQLSKLIIFGALEGGVGELQDLLAKMQVDLFESRPDLSGASARQEPAR